MTFRTRSRLCCGVSGFCVIGDNLPWTFIDGGTPAVMNRSDAFLCAISFRNEVKSILLILRSLYGDERAPVRRARHSTPMDHSNRRLSLAYSLAWILVIRPRLTKSCKFWSRVCMPTFWPVWIEEYICATLSSRIRLRIAG